VLHYACLAGASKNLVQLLLDFNDRLDEDEGHYDKALLDADDRKPNPFDLPKVPLGGNDRGCLSIGVESLSPGLRLQKTDPAFRVEVTQPMTSLLPKKKKGLDV